MNIINFPVSAQNTSRSSSQRYESGHQKDRFQKDKKGSSLQDRPHFISHQGLFLPQNSSFKLALMSLILGQLKQLGDETNNERLESDDSSDQE